MGRSEGWLRYLTITGSLEVYIYFMSLRNAEESSVETIRFV